MTDYAVGDVQGCLEPLHCLLEQVGFRADRDRLMLVGDLVNRGPDSVGVLRYLKSLGRSAICVLGNHDLHLLAVAAGIRPPHHKDTFTDVLDAPDRDDLLHWLRQRPLAWYDAECGYVMTHAGIPPGWSLQKTLSLAAEVHTVLRSPNAIDYFREMYGNEPAYWDESLNGMARLRVITNYLTRMRFCNSQGVLDLENKSGPGTAAAGFLPWFKVDRPPLGAKVLFGHWASQEGHTGVTGVHALDTGCVWGRSLRLMRLSDEQLFHCECLDNAEPL